jgi:hypothetical protein
MTDATAKFTVVESICETAKSSPDKNEDRLIIEDDFVAVVDGSTSSSPIRGVAGGIVAAQSVADVVKNLSPRSTAAQFVTAATAELARRVGSWPDPTLSGPSASVVVWSRSRDEIWRVGDCHFRLDGAEYPGEKEIDRIAYAFRCAVVRARLALGLTSIEAERDVPTMKQPFLPLVEIQHAFRNADIDDPLAYGAIDGRPVPGRFIEIHSTTGVARIVLCSDGFNRPFTTLDEGLADLERIRRDDPLMVTSGFGSRPFPAAGKFFDDTTYVRLEVGRW